MIDINELRRLTQAATPGPWHATKSVETNSWAVWSDTTRLMELRPTKTVDMYQVSNTAAFIAAANPAAISELLDRLEAAEKAVTEAYQRGYATGREEIAAERDALRAAVRHEADCVCAAKAEIDALRAKIAEMERQEPVAFVLNAPKLKRCAALLDAGKKLPHKTKLYALPSAQPAPSAPDGWQLVVEALLREVERQTCAHEETHRGGFMWEICDSCGAKWADDEGGKPEFKWPKCVERARAMLAAAPEAKS